MKFSTQQMRMLIFVAAALLFLLGPEFLGPATPLRAQGCSAAMTVANQTELDAAITCFNGQTTAGTYQITLTADITLTSSTTKIDNGTADIDLVIDGAGFTVDGGGTLALRVFEIASGSDVTMQEITITGGNRLGSTGGGILNAGSLAIYDSTLHNNQAGFGGAINSSGTLNVERSTFSGNSAVLGAAIDSNGSLTINNSTFSGNGDSASGGTAVDATGGSISSSTFYNNSSNNNYAILGGGAIESEGTLIVSGSTFAGNRSVSGGAISSGGDLTVDNSTFSANHVMPDFGFPGAGQAIYANGGSIRSSTFYQNDSTAGSAAVTVNSRNLTLSNNVFVKGANSANCFVESGLFPGSLSDGGGNVSDDASCPTSAGSLSNTATLLGGLTNNGGPTQTHALLTGSQAIDFIPITSGNNADRVTATCPGLDQRGFERGGGDGLGGDACDSGAFEYDSAEPTAIALRVFEARSAGWQGGMVPALLFMGALLLSGWMVARRPKFGGRQTPGLLPRIGERD